MKNYKNWYIKLYENTYNQIASNLAEMKRIQDKECFLDDYDKLKELNKETLILISDAKETFFKKIEIDYSDLIKLEKKLDKINIQFNLEEEFYGDAIEATLDSICPNQCDDVK